MTETTTQPDPRVVAWMREHRATCPEITDGDLLLDAAMIGRFGAVPLAVRAASLIAARKPLTVADIPAGQGAASLFIGTGYRGELAVMYRTGLTHDHVFMTEGPDDPSEARRAMWDHLAATLPTVDTTEESN